MILTVAVPTYNRESYLLKNMPLLFSQLRGKAKLLIIDNHSNAPAESVLGDLLTQYDGIDYKIIRNNANVGGNQNILRCIECADTQWVWTLGDDDEVFPNAIDIILEDIKNNPDTVFINYRGDKDKQPYRTQGLEQFCSEMPSFGDVLFMSSNIFNRCELAPSLYTGNHYTYSLAPHLALIIPALSEGKECYFSNKRLVVPGSRGSWSRANFTLGVYSLLEIPMSQRSREILSKKIFHMAAPILLGAIRELIFKAANSEKSSESLFLYRSIKTRFKVAGAPLFFQIKLFFYEFFFYFPKLSLTFLSQIYKIQKGHDPEMYDTEL
jgi:glycosyltransferase involved in cell wall biosynthesis